MKKCSRLTRTHTIASAVLREGSANAALIVASSFRSAAGSCLAECTKPVDRLAGGDDGDALMTSHRQQVTLVT